MNFATLVRLLLKERKVHAVDITKDIFFVLSHYGLISHYNHIRRVAILIALKY